MRTYGPLAILFLLSVFTQVKTANILFYFGVSTYSHRIIAWPLVEELAARGHNVTFLSPFPAKEPNPNVTEIVPKELTELMNIYFATGSDLIRDRFDGKKRAGWTFLPMLGIETCELLFKLPEFNEWVAQSQFDLVFIDAVYGECGVGLAYKWNAKVAYFKTNTMFPWEYDMFGAPMEASWIPDVSNDFSQDMTFLTRVKNTLIPLANYWYHTWIYHPPLEAALRKGLSLPKMPSMYDLMGNVSLVLMNADYSTDYARSVPPMFVQVPGMLTVRSESKALPKDMSKFIDSATTGFIYVSFGSAVQVAKMEPAFQQIFFSAFGNSSLKFIWKYEGDEIPAGMPSNVFTAKWMPQQTILKHPRCRGFITHGGLGSIHEALSYAVPIIVMPVFVDQDYNAERVVRLGHGLSLELTTLTQQELETAIWKLSNDPSFKEKTDELSNSLKDRQNNPLETAVWWTEKVLRSSDFELSLLRPLGRSQLWFVRRSLDVFFFVFMLAITPMFLIAIILKRAANAAKNSRLKPKKLKKTKAN